MNAKKCIKIFVFLACAAFFLLFCFTFPYEVFVGNDMLVLTKSEWEKLCQNKFVSICDSLQSAYADDGQIDEYVIKYKLFNMSNITSLKVKVLDDNKVWLGGETLGFSLKTRGVVVVGGNVIITQDGKYNPMKDAGIVSGDLIVRMGDKMTNSAEDIGEILRMSNGGDIEVEYIRNGVRYITTIKPAYDVLTKSYKLGLWIKEDALGVGTLTYILPDNLRFGSLGHAINNGNSDEILEVSGGSIYECSVVGVKKGKSGAPGELIGMFSKTDAIGDIDKNTEYGVYGYYFDTEKFDDKRKIEIGGKASARPGRATIVSCINGEDVKEYEIEIIKTNYQSNGGNKGLVFRVIDKDLLDKTGGIVQGMSGSPIIQNGKIIGAVTHVFVNDASKGTGLYIDLMLTN